MIDFEMFKKLISAGQEVSLKVSGNSMFPFLADKADTVTAVRPDREIKKGDIVFFTRADSTVVMHRVAYIKDGAFYLRGDAQQKTEGPVYAEQIFALVTAVIHNGKLYGEKSLYFRFYKTVWNAIVKHRPRIIALIQKFV